MGEEDQIDWTSDDWGDDYGYSDTGEEVQDWQNTDNSGTGEVSDPSLGYSDTGEEVQDWQNVSKTGDTTSGNLSTADGIAKFLNSNPMFAGLAKTLGAVGIGKLADKLMNVNKGPGGYQGGIPTLTAYREQLPIPQTMTNAQGQTVARRPGSGGVTYFSPMQYLAPGQAPATTATGSAGTGGTGAGSTTAMTNNPILEAAIAAKKAGVSYGSGVDQDKNTSFTGDRTSPPGSSYNGKILSGEVAAGYDPERFYTHEYTDQDQKRDEYLRSMNPTFRADREAEKAKIANLGSTGGEYVGIGDFMRQQTSNLGSVGPVYDLTGQSAIKAGGIMQANQNSTQQQYARGGITTLGGYSDGGRLLRGPGDGVSDSIPAVIGKKQPARLADGEFVVPARIVSELGNGSTEAGARKLYAMMDRIKKARSRAKNIAADTKADKHLPA